MSPPPEAAAHHHHHHHHAFDCAAAPDSHFVHPNSVHPPAVDFMVLFINLVLACAFFGFLFRTAKREYSCLLAHMQHGHHTTLLNYARYRLDFFLTNWHSAKGIILFTLGYALIVLGGLVYSVASGEDLVEAFWTVWLMVVDTSRHGDEHGIMLRSLSFVITMLGMLLFALMIGLISDFIVRLLDQLHEGTAQVVEEDHVVILGWSETIVEVVRQLCLANESEGGGVICILANKPKEEMEKVIEDHLPESALLGSIVVCRSGMPILAKDLKHVSTTWARSVIILADVTQSADQSDAQVLRTVLCLRQIRKAKSKFHVVAELRETENKDLVLVADDEHTDVCVSPDVIGCIMMQCSRSPVLAQVFTSLLGFEGNEFYVQAWPELVSRTFAEVLFRFPSAIPIGLKLRGTGKLVLNPRGDYVLKPGDEVVVIAEDNDTYRCEELSGAAKAALSSTVLGNAIPRDLAFEKFLLIGFRKNLEDLIIQIDELVRSGTEVIVMCDLPVEERMERMSHGGLDAAKLKRIRLINMVGNPACRRDYAELDLTSFTSILILADTQFEQDVASSDSLALATLLLVNDILRKQFEAKAVAAAAAAAPVRPVLTATSNGSSRNLITASSSSANWPTSPLSPNGRNATSDTVEPSRQSSGYGTLRRMPSSGNETTPARAQSPVKQLRSMVKSMGSGSGEKSRLSTLPTVIELDKPTQGPVVLSEFLDTQTKALVAGMAANHVMSNEVVAQVLAMQAEDRSVNAIFQELLHAGGNSLHIREAYPDYLGNVAEPCFWHMMSKAVEKQEVALGYITGGRQLFINPEDKNKRLPKDVTLKVIVLCR